MYTLLLDTGEPEPVIIGTYPTIDEAKGMVGLPWLLTAGQWHTAEHLGHALYYIAEDNE